MRMLTIWLCAASFLLSGRVECTAQTADTPPPSVFQQLFPKPTGQNGFEDLVMAGELARSSARLTKTFEAGATLTDKRAALDDPDVRRALLLVRQGLAKPIVNGLSANDGLTFSVFSVLRNLARLLAVEQYVLLADGKVSAAIDSLRDGLRIGYIVQSEKLVGSLVGVAIDSIVLNALARRLDQLSARDCEKVMALAQEWLRSPDPAITALPQSECPS